MTISERARQVQLLLDRKYPENIDFLHYKTPYQLCISVILSAQTTDAQVNRVTPELFNSYPGPDDLAAAPIKNIERIIHSTGFYKIKARRIKDAAAFIAQQFGGQVPDTMEHLVKVPGMGRKSANVVLHHCFNKPAVIVDTHFGRVCRRLGLTENKNPEKLEKDIQNLLPGERWSRFSMTVNMHGRRVCFARKPACHECLLAELCPSSQQGGYIGDF